MAGPTGLTTVAGGNVINTDLGNTPASARSVLTLFREQRRSPRLVATGQAVVLTVDGETSTVRSCTRRERCGWAIARK